MEFNKFDLKKRPYLNIPDFKGEDGNPIRLAGLFSTAMNSAGLREEAVYFGGSDFKKVLNHCSGLDYKFISTLIFAMTETNVEIIEKNKDNDDDEVIVIRKKKSSLDNENYLGRNKLYYTNTSDMLENMIMGDSLTDKDKIGMTPLDHYALSGKVNELALALQFLYINNDLEECREVMENQILNTNLIQVKKNSTCNTLIYTNMVDFYINQDPKIIENTKKTIESLLKEHKYKNKDIDEDILSLADIITNAIDICQYKSEGNAFTNSLFLILKDFTLKDTTLNSYIKKSETLNEIINKMVEKEKQMLSALIENDATLVEDKIIRKARRL